MVIPQTSGLPKKQREISLLDRKFTVAQRGRGSPWAASNSSPHHSRTTQALGPWSSNTEPFPAAPWPWGHSLPFPSSDTLP